MCLIRICYEGVLICGASDEFHIGGRLKALAAAYESQVSWSQWDHVASSSEVPPSSIHVCSGEMSLSPVLKWTREYYLMYLGKKGFKMQKCLFVCMYECILNMSIFTLWYWFFYSSEGSEYFFLHCMYNGNFCRWHVDILSPNATSPADFVDPLTFSSCTTSRSNISRTPSGWIDIFHSSHFGVK